MINLSKIDSDEKTIELNNSSIIQLTETKKWTMFLSVMGFVIFGLLIIIGSIAITISPSGYTFASFLPFLLMTFIYFFPIYYLFQFSRYSKKAFINLDSELLSIALKYLKMHYRYMGILVIVLFGVYLIMFLFMLVSGNYNNLF